MKTFVCVCVLVFHVHKLLVVSHYTTALSPLCLKSKLFYVQLHRIIKLCPDGSKKYSHHWPKYFFLY